MSEEKELQVKKDGITFHLLNTPKYKTNFLSLRLKAPLSKEHATKRSLLANVLQSGTNKLPSTKDLRSYLDELYGAAFSADVQKKGEYHILTLSMEVANEKFLSDSEPLLEKALQFLKDVLLDPKTENDQFDKSIVEKEKRTLKKRLQAVYDDKMRYASLRLIEEMCAGEPYAIPANGLVEDIDSITAKGLYEYYQQSLAEDEIDLYIIGDIDEKAVLQICENELKFKDRTPQLVKFSNPARNRDEKTVIDRQQVAQGKLNIGFRTNTSYGEADYFALQIFNGLFGGFPHSKLFINVRERASLAYYAASRIESHKGLLLVMTGIETRNYEKALSIIKEQMAAMKNGEFTDHELEQTKAVIQNQMMETLDTSRGLTEILYHNVISKKNITKDHWLNAIKNVTKEDVIRVGEKINLDTVYFLSGMEG